MSGYYFDNSSDNSSNSSNNLSDTDTDTDEENSQETATTVSNSSIDDYTDDGDDDGEEDAIFWEDEEFVNSEKENGQYILGIAHHIDGYSTYVHGITAKTFYKFPFQNVMNYLYYYSITRIENPVLDIIQIQIDQDGRYIAIQKTYWLRMFQKCWRKFYREKKDIIQKRMKVSSLCFRQITGRWPGECSPSLSCKGILSRYLSYI